MFGLGFSEILLILVVALIVFGPKRLPEIAQGLGRALGDFRRAMDDVKREMVFPPMDSRSELPTGATPAAAAPPPKEQAAAQPAQGEGQPVKPAE